MNKKQDLRYKRKSWQQLLFFAMKYYTNFFFKGDLFWLSLSLKVRGNTSDSFIIVTVKKRESRKMTNNTVLSNMKCVFWWKRPVKASFIWTLRCDDLATVCRVNRQHSGSRLKNANDAYVKKRELFEVWLQYIRLGLLGKQARQTKVSG